MPVKVRNNVAKYAFSIFNSSEVNKAAVTALIPLKNETQANARRLRQPGKSPSGGHLDQGVTIARRQRVSRAVWVCWVAFKGRARGLAHLVEFGTAPHLQPRRRTMHPGAAPKPFIRPAFESQKTEVVRVFGDQMARIMNNVFGKGRSSL